MRKNLFTILLVALSIVIVVLEAWWWYKAPCSLIKATNAQTPGRCIK